MMNELEKEIISQLYVYNPKNSKIRIGGGSDGGYVTVGGYLYDLYISCGIGDNVSFDNHFVSINECQSYLAFDGTCNRPYSLDNRINFIPKNISNSESENTTNLLSYTSEYNNIFLKMDIEGHEWNWIKSFGDLSKFKQIVIECHGFFDEDCPTGSWKSLGFFEHQSILDSLLILNKTHHLVHIHGNNAAVVKHYDNTFGNAKGYDEWLTVGELTFIRKDCEVDGLNKQSLPIQGLDYGNYHFIPEVNMNKPPFVNI